MAIKKYSKRGGSKKFMGKRTTQRGGEEPKQPKYSGPNTGASKKFKHGFISRLSTKFSSAFKKSPKNVGELVNKGPGGNILTNKMAQIMERTKEKQAAAQNDSLQPVSNFTKMIQSKAAQLTSGKKASINNRLQSAYNPNYVRRRLKTITNYGSDINKAKAIGFLNTNVRQNGESSTLPRGVSSNLQILLQKPIKKPAPVAPLSGSTQNASTV